MTKCSVCDGTLEHHWLFLLVPGDTLCQNCFRWALSLGAVKHGNYLQITR